MSARSIPPLLEPYLALPPEASLVVLTSVLGASSNWLVLRHLHAYLKNGGGSGIADADEGNDVGVVLVSFMRDGAFWRDGAGRIGLDLDSLSRGGRFSFVDGLTGLVDPGEKTAGERGGRQHKDRIIAGSRSIDDVRTEIEAAFGDLGTSRKVLVVDQLDAYLAVAPGDDVTSTSLSTMLLSLRERAHSTLLTFSADDPLLHAQTTTLEREQAALVLGQVHSAGRLLALRMLDTGTARDVSGVVRVTGSLDGGEGGGREFLYYVAADGGVRVFERGT